MFSFSLTNRKKNNNYNKILHLIALSRYSNIQYYPLLLDVLRASFLMYFENIVVIVVVVLNDAILYYLA